MEDIQNHNPAERCQKIADCTVPGLTVTLEFASLYGSMEELQDEIDYQEMLLTVLDDNVVDRENAEIAVTQEISQLRIELEARKQVQLRTQL